MLYTYVCSLCILVDIYQINFKIYYTSHLVKHLCLLDCSENSSYTLTNPDEKILKLYILAQKFDTKLLVVIMI